MSKAALLVPVAAVTLATPGVALAQAQTRMGDETARSEPARGAEQKSADSGQPIKEVFSTGVAKGRDRLDAAVSTSSLRGEEIQKLGARNLAEVIRNIPGIRVETDGEGLGSYTIRGLPLADYGAKFVQFQEDGLPVLEFGDIIFQTPDLLLRADLNLAQIEAIRGGSASTFASNAPGGVINLISKTGETEGGALQLSSGIDYREYRADFDYGARLGKTLRFHAGGFYRAGEGPRHVGYTASRGGQVKVNLTKELPTGYVRIYGKYLNDRNPLYLTVPMQVSGTDKKPRFTPLPGFDAGRDALISKNVSGFLTPDARNEIERFDIRDGLNPVVKSVGLEASIGVGDWTVVERFRYADISGRIRSSVPLAAVPVPVLPFFLGLPGGLASFATGPNAGQPIMDPMGLNGNGLLTASFLLNHRIKALDNITNDLRASRVWKIAGGDLTTTAGLYASRQTIANDLAFLFAVTDVRGGGDVALVDIRGFDGTLQTQSGIYSFNATVLSSYDVDYDMLAPYGSLNYKIGKAAFGASIRYDRGKVNGRAFGTSLGSGSATLSPLDIDGNGVISAAETRTGTLDFDQPSKVDYGYGYLSYSVSLNYRVSKSLAVFGRYSRGGRAAADRILLSPAIDPVTGRLTDPDIGADSVHQTEAGLKFRRENMSVNLTAFLADTAEVNRQIAADASGNTTVALVDRDYRAYGLEFEGAIRLGGFGVTAGATYTKAEIRADATAPDIVGNSPRRQPELIYQLTPQYNTRLFTLGASVVGVTDSYTQDANLLRMPGYTAVNAFLNIRPAKHVTLLLNVNNLFNVRGLVEVTQAFLPPSGVALVRTINPRAISAALRFSL